MLIKIITIICQVIIMFCCSIIGCILLACGLIGYGIFTLLIAFGCAVTIVYIAELTKKEKALYED